MDEQKGKGSRREQIKVWKAEARQHAVEYLNERKSCKTVSERKTLKAKYKASIKEWKTGLKSLDRVERADQKKAFKALKKRTKRTQRIIGWVLVLALLCSIGYAVSPIVKGFGKSYMLKFTDETDAAVEARAAGAATSEQIADEGMVLLMNENSALPLSDKKVNVFGGDAYNFGYSGGGSGSVDTSNVKTFFEGLDAAGISYNPELHQMYMDASTAKEQNNGLLASIIASRFGNQVNEDTSVAALSDDMIVQAKNYSDRAIIVLTSIPVEGADMDREELCISESRRELIDRVTAVFDKVTIILNCGNPMELGFLEEYSSIDSILWAGLPGPYGCISIGKILAGDLNPSGRLVDTWAYDLTSAPASVNFTTDRNEYLYDNSNMAYINYEEGIYVGYRYYETRYLNDEDGYRKAVQFPFGFGLSFTEFTWETESYETDDENIIWQVKVTNTGKTAGKDVVELYFSAPYTPGGIEKSAIELAAFAKTGELAPGSSEIITLTMATRDLSSYDMSKGAYVLDEGTYEIKLGRSVHDIIEQQTYEVGETLVYDTDEVTGAELDNRFDYTGGGLTYLSRNDWEETYPGTGKENKTLSNDVLKEIEQYNTVTSSDADMPITGAQNGLQLADLKGVSYDDPTWDAYMDQFDYKELLNVVSWAGWHVEAVERLGVPETNMVDGPAGINTNIPAAAYPAEIVVASTWNTELGYALGEAVGKEAAADNIWVWYAPAMNLHRTAQGGRNFEYYSEDPVLSGKIAAATICGAQDQGVTVAIKHFILNNEETNARDGIYTWVNEQALRELYLRPFEIAVKEGEAHGIMTAFTHLGYKWCGASSELLQEVLREEWGFEGFVTTDVVLTKFMDAKLAIRSGNDLMLSSGLVNSEKIIANSYKADPAGTLLALRECVQHLLYTLVNYTGVV